MLFALHFVTLCCEQFTRWGGAGIPARLYANPQSGRPRAQPAKREALRGKSRGKNLENSIAQKEKSDIHRGLRNAHPRSIRLLPVILYRISHSILLFFYSTMVNYFTLLHK